jgi:hypothetical protein
MQPSPDHSCLDFTVKMRLTTASQVPNPVKKSAIGVQSPRLIVICMRKKGSAANGHSRLEEALAMLIQNRAAFLRQVSETDRQHSE